MAMWIRRDAPASDVYWTSRPMPHRQTSASPAKGDWPWLVMTMTLQPVASFNYGARKYHRVRQAAVFTLKAAFALLVVLIAVCWWNDENLIRLFRDDPEVTAVALPAFRYQCFAILLQPVIVVTNMTFQSVGKAGRATFLACCRQGVCFIPLILVLPRVLGLVGVELCQPIADALTFFISLPFLLAFLRQLEQMDKAEASHAPAQL
mgnify:CR=1 FL=1